LPGCTDGATSITTSVMVGTETSPTHRHLCPTPSGVLDQGELRCRSVEFWGIADLVGDVAAAIRSRNGLWVGFRARRQQSSGVCKDLIFCVRVLVNQVYDCP
jgi:hypothetical protein